MSRAQLRHRHRDSRDANAVAAHGCVLGGDHPGRGNDGARIPTLRAQADDVISVATTGSDLVAHPLQLPFAPPATPTSP